ncbi:MAG: oligosaccharide flippase family protein [Candidatus Pacebacteria bacterium]|nr:oligosaccharide flippase family protein [Candidatus Paceibacterota bacterium]
MLKYKDMWRNTLLRFYRDSLVQNSLYPMLGTAVMAGLGFFFWLFATRLFTDEQVGLAATLISAMSMLSALSLVGIDTTTIRFLAKEERKNESITTGLIVVGFAALVLSGLFVVLVGVISPELAFIQHTTLMVWGFMIFSIMTALNIYTDAIFLAYRTTKFTFIIDTTFSILKVALPFAFVAWGAYGIFLAAAIAQGVGFVLSVIVLAWRIEYRPTWAIDTNFLIKTWRYSTGNYIADALNFLPTTLLPLIIVHVLGAAQSAYYYVVFMIVSLLYVIPTSTTRALFAEGSFDEAGIPTLIRRALRTTALIQVPAMLVLLVGGSSILSLFGAEYAQAGSGFLSIMTLASIPVAVFALYGSLFRLTHAVGALIVRNLVFVTSTLVLVYVLLPLGLVGVGLAYGAGTALASILSHLMYRAQVHAPSRPAFVGRTPAPRTFANLPRRIRARYRERILWPFTTYLIARRTYLAYLFRNGFRRKTILCYPDLPQWYHILYKICPHIGFRITNNPNTPADIYMRFEDTTVGVAYPALTNLATKHPVLNLHCIDISKAHVEEVFNEVFGYGMVVDPRTHTGVCVRKSNENAVHDGTIITAPCEPKAGYIYQTFINTACDGTRPMDLRIPIFQDKIPFILKRYKSTDDIFDITLEVEFADVDSVLTDKEKKLVIEFARRMGLDYGEMDALRNCDDGRLYIVDVNNTPGGPVGPLYGNRPLLARWYAELIMATREAFV